MRINKTKLLLTLVILLTILNVSTIASIWRFIDFSKLSMITTHAPIGGPKDFIISKLDLNEEQQKVFEELRQEHFQEMKNLQDNIRVEKDAMYDLLKSDQPDTTASYQHIARIMQNEEKLEHITFNHFRKVRAICTAEQQQHFDVIIDEVMRMLMRPPRPHAPGAMHQNNQAKDEHYPLP